MESLAKTSHLLTYGTSAAATAQDKTKLVQNAATEIHQLSGVIKARSNPVPDYDPTNSKPDKNDDAPRFSTGDDNKEKVETSTTDPGAAPNNPPVQKNIINPIITPLVDENAASFTLPVTTIQILANLEILEANSDSLAKFGIVVESLADALWTLIGHVVNVGEVSIQLYQKQQQQQMSSTTTSSRDGDDLLQEQQILKEEKNQKAARAAFMFQAPIVSSCVSLWDSLSKVYAAKLFESPLEQGKQSVVAWCEKLTNRFFATLPGTESENSESSNNQPSQNNSKSSLQHFFSIMSSTIQDSINKSRSSNLFFAKNIISTSLSSSNEARFGAIFVDVVIALWTLLESCCNCLERRLLLQTKKVVSASSEIVVIRVEEVTEFYSAASAYFLGSGARSFAKESNNAAALRWSTISLMTFLPVVDEYFGNGNQVQTQFLLEHLPDVLTRRFSTEQMSVVVAFLFAKVFNNVNNLYGVMPGHQHATLKAPQRDILIVDANNMKKLAKSLADHHHLIEIATTSLASEPRNGTNQSPSTTSTQITSASFHHQPAKAFVCCLVAMLTIPGEGDWNVTEPETIKDFDSATRLLSLAFRRCILESCQSNDESTSSSASTPSQQEKLEENSTRQNQNQNENQIHDASAAMAQIVVACMVQRLDVLRRNAAVRRGMAPWDNRFQLFSSSAQHHNAFLLEQQRRILIYEQNDKEENSLKKVSFTSILGRIMMTEWISRTLLQFPAPAYYQSPLAENQLPTKLDALTTSSSPFVLILRSQLLRCVIFPFSDLADVVAAQNPDCAHIVASCLLNSLMSSSSSSSPSSTTTDSLLSTTSIRPRIASASTISSKMEVITHDSLTATTTSTTATTITSVIEPPKSPNIVASSKNASLLQYRNFDQFTLIRANQCIAITEKIRRSAFQAIDLAEPWGKLIPRRLYSETSLTLYDVTALAFSALAADALTVKNDVQFLQGMLQITRKLIPLAQPFCRAALESPATVGALIDRFEQSMADVERENNSSQNRASIVNRRPTRPLTFRYLVASFTLSGMTDREGMRVMPNEVFASRWVPLLYRACTAIASNEVTRNVLEVHCRNCCSALLRSRRTVCPSSSASVTTSSTSSSTIIQLYDGSITTENFLARVSTFLTWIIRPVVSPARTVTNRKLAGSSFDATFDLCILSVERLETEKTGIHTGRKLCCDALAEVGRALVTQIRQLTPQIRTKEERLIYIEGSTRFASGFGKCVACLDSSVRSVVQYWINLIMLSLLVVFPMESKKKVRDAMAQAIGNSRHFRGDEQFKMAMWIAQNEPKWLREDGSNIVLNNNNNGSQRPIAVTFVQGKL